MSQLNADASSWEEGLGLLSGEILAKTRNSLWNENTPSGCPIETARLAKVLFEQLRSAHCKRDERALAESILKVVNLVDVSNRGRIQWSDLTNFCVDAAARQALTRERLSFEQRAITLYEKSPGFVDNFTHCQEVGGLLHVPVTDVLAVVESGNRSVKLYRRGMKRSHELCPAIAVRDHMAALNSSMSSKKSNRKERESKLSLSAEDVLAVEYLGKQRRTQVCISCGDGNLSVWDVSSGKLLKYLWVRHHEIGLRYCAKTDLLISWSSSRSRGSYCARIRSASTLGVLATISGTHTAEIRDSCELALPPDTPSNFCTSLCTAGMDGRIAVWDITYHHEKPQGAAAATAPVSSLFDQDVPPPPTGNRQRGDSNLPNPRLLHARRAALIKQRLGIMSLAYSQKCNLILVAGFDVDMYALDSTSLNQRLILRGHRCSLVGLCIVARKSQANRQQHMSSGLDAEDRVSRDISSRKMELVVSVDGGGTCKVWDLCQSEAGLVHCLQTFYCESSSVSGSHCHPKCMALGWDGLLVASSKVHFFELSQKAEDDNRESPVDVGISNISGDISILRLQYGGGKISIADLDTGVGEIKRVVRPSLRSGRDVTAACFDANMKILFIGFLDGAIGAYHAATGAALSSYRRSQHVEVSSLLHVEGDYALLSTYTDGCLSVLDGKCTDQSLTLRRSVLKAHEAEIRLCACSRRLGLIVTAATDSTLRVWDFSTLRITSAHYDLSVADACFMNPLAALAIAESSGSLSIWQARSGKRLKKIMNLGMGSSPSAFGFFTSRLTFFFVGDEEGRAEKNPLWEGRLAAGSENGYVRLWKIKGRNRDGTTEMCDHQTALSVCDGVSASIKFSSTGKGNFTWKDAMDTLSQHSHSQDTAELIAALLRKSDKHQEKENGVAFASGLGHDPDLIWSAGPIASIRWLTMSDGVKVLATCHCSGRVKFWSEGGELLGDVPEEIASPRSSMDTPSSLPPKWLLAGSRQSMKSRLKDNVDYVLRPISPQNHSLSSITLKDTNGAKKVPSVLSRAEDSSREQDGEHDASSNETDGCSDNDAWPHDFLFKQLRRSQGIDGESSVCATEISLPTSLGLFESLAADLHPHQSRQTSTTRGRRPHTSHHAGARSWSSTTMNKTESQIPLQYANLSSELQRKVARKWCLMKSNTPFPDFGESEDEGGGNFLDRSNTSPRPSTAPGVMMKRSGPCGNPDRLLFDQNLPLTSISAKRVSSNFRPTSQQMRHGRPRSAFAIKVDNLLERFDSQPSLPSREPNKTYRDPIDGASGVRETLLAHILQILDQADPNDRDDSLRALQPKDHTLMEPRPRQRQQRQSMGRQTASRCSSRRNSSRPSSRAGADRTAAVAITDVSKRRTREANMPEIGLIGASKNNPVSQFAGPYTIEQVLGLQTIFNLFEIPGTGKAHLHDLASNSVIASHRGMSKALRIVAGSLPASSRSTGSLPSVMGYGGGLITLDQLLPTVFRFAKKEETHRMIHVIRLAKLADSLASIPSPHTQLHALASFDPNFLNSSLAIAPRIYRLPQSVSADIRAAFSYSERNGCGSLNASELWQVFSHVGLLRKLGMGSLTSFMKTVELCGLDENREITGEDFQAIMVTLWAASGDGVRENRQLYAPGNSHKLAQSPVEVT